MAFSTTQNFMQQLNGVSVRELNKQLDYSKNQYPDRLEVVEKILGETDFYEEYFSDYFKASINSGDPLSSEVNVCKSLERMADYLLNSKDIKQEEDLLKVKYVFYTDRKYFEKKIAREESVRQLAGSLTDSDEDNSIVHMMRDSERNSKKGKKQKITASDLNRTDKLGEVLRDYHKLFDLVTAELKNKDSIHNRYLLTKTKKEVTDDMTYSKDAILGVWGYKPKNVSESCVPDIDIFDFTNETHVKGAELVFTNKQGKPERIAVKGLLYFEPTLEIDNDFSLVLYDFQKTVEKAGLNERELYILNGLRSGAMKVEIARDLEITPANITYYVNQITHKIIAVGDKYDLA